MRSGGDCPFALRTGLRSRLRTAGLMIVDDYNPFAAPESGVGLLPPSATSDEALRLRHIECEKNIDSIAQLMTFGGPLIGFAAVCMAFFVVNRQIVPFVFVTITCLGLAAFHVLIGIGLHRLRPWSRPWAILVSTVWLMAVPFGTIIAAGTIVVLTRPAARFVLTDDYKQVIARTPNIVHRTSVPAQIVAALVLTGIGLFLLLRLG